jgi:predicted DNA-binding antitoxin AbrB/MazE fold protein
MALTVEAIYENGVLKPTQALPLKEREKVQITIHTAASRVQATAGLIPCRDAKLIERVAEDDEFSLLEAPSRRSTAIPGYSGFGERNQTLPGASHDPYRRSHV